MRGHTEGRPPPAGAGRGRRGCPRAPPGGDRGPLAPTPGPGPTASRSPGESATPFVCDRRGGAARVMVSRIQPLPPPSSHGQAPRQGGLAHLKRVAHNLHDQHGVSEVNADEGGAPPWGPAHGRPRGSAGTCAPPAAALPGRAAPESKEWRLNGVGPGSGP